MSNRFCSYETISLSSTSFVGVVFTMMVILQSLVLSSRIFCEPEFDVAMLTTMYNLFTNLALFFLGLYGILKDDMEMLMGVFIGCVVLILDIVVICIVPSPLTTVTDNTLLRCYVHENLAGIERWLECCGYNDYKDYDVNDIPLSCCEIQSKTCSADEAKHRPGCNGRMLQWRAPLLVYLKFITALNFLAEIFVIISGTLVVVYWYRKDRRYSRFFQSIVHESWK